MPDKKAHPQFVQGRDQRREKDFEDTSAQRLVFTKQVNEINRKVFQAVLQDRFFDSDMIIWIG
jgi:hypothetical protein